MDAIPGAGGSGVLAGRYEVGALVGLGGTARVYRARDQVGDATVAVKIFPAGSAAGPAVDGSRELAALGGMRHPGLVGVRDSGVDDDGRPFVVMDFVDGQSLAARLREGALPAAAAVVMGTTLADALAHVHANGVVHRDVKPGNVLLDGDGRAQLTDFGIARLVDATRVTATGLVVGTAAYMAPEQVRGEVVGPPADIYALGLVLLEAVTGRREFEGGALESAIARLHRSPVVPASVPEPLASMVRRMTATDPADRPAASDVAAALRRRPTRRRPLEGPLARRLVSAGAFASLAASVVAGMVLLSGADTSAGAPGEPAVQVAAPEPVRRAARHDQPDPGGGRRACRRRTDPAAPRPGARRARPARPARHGDEDGRPGDDGSREGGRTHAGEGPQGRSGQGRRRQDQGRRRQGQGRQGQGQGRRRQGRQAGRRQGRRPGSAEGRFRRLRRRRQQR